MADIQSSSHASDCAQQCQENECTEDDLDGRTTAGGRTTDGWRIRCDIRVPTFDEHERTRSEGTTMKRTNPFELGIYMFGKTPARGRRSRRHRASDPGRPRVHVAEQVRLDFFDFGGDEPLVYLGG